jgi:hypothetical protein
LRRSIVAQCMLSIKGAQVHRLLSIVSETANNFQTSSKGVDGMANSCELYFRPW